MSDFDSPTPGSATWTVTLENGGTATAASTGYGFVRRLQEVLKAALIAAGGTPEVVLGSTRVRLVGATFPVDGAWGIGTTAALAWRVPLLATLAAQAEAQRRVSVPLLSAAVVVVSAAQFPAHRTVNLPPTATPPPYDRRAPGVAGIVWTTDGAALTTPPPGVSIPADPTVPTTPIPLPVPGDSGSYLPAAVPDTTPVRQGIASPNVGVAVGVTVVLLAAVLAVYLAKKDQRERGLLDRRQPKANPSGCGCAR